MSYKKLFILVIASGLIGGVIGSLVSTPYLSALTNNSGERANIFDAFRGIFGGLRSPKGGSPGGLSPQSPAEYVSRIDYEQAIISAVEKASPAVVSIAISKDVPIIEQCPVDPFSGIPRDFFGDFFGLPGQGNGFQFYQPCEKGTERQEVGGGSGFIISSDGLIVTNKHVALDMDASYVVFLSSGEKYDAKIVAQDPILDLALLEISAENLPTISLGNSDGVRLGQSVIAIGNALGEFRNTVSVGVVSGLSRTITAYGGGGFQETIEGVIQTDAAINRGNSGGPLLNLAGEVIGINTAIASGAQNIGFSIPVNQIKRAIISFQKDGEIIIPYLGVRYLSLNQALAETEELSVSSGALIRGSDDGPAVMPDSPADKAGVRAEDVILNVGGQRIDDTHSLSSLIQRYNVGEEVVLGILRDGEEVELRAVLEKREF